MYGVYLSFSLFLEALQPGGLPAAMAKPKWNFMNIDDFTFIFTLTKHVEFDFMFFYMPGCSFDATLIRQCLIKDDVLQDMQIA